jgi:DnaJ-class molecular chaperone
MLSILTNNNHLYNYYELFEIINTSSTKQIIKAYQNKIMNYNNENLSQIEINEIKILKMGLYILITTDLRIIYDHLLNDQLKCNQENNEKISISPAKLEDAQGVSSFKTEYTEGNSLDALFNIDNTWKDKITINTSNNDEKESGYKKTQNKTDIITNRIFSMAEFNKKPDFPSDFETELRKPLQGRVEKKQL